MPAIKSVETGHYRIPLEVALTDSTHGTMTAFEIVTVRVTDSDGMEGVGIVVRKFSLRILSVRHAGNEEKEHESQK